MPCMLHLAFDALWGLLSVSIGQRVHFTHRLQASHECCGPAGGVHILLLSCSLEAGYKNSTCLTKCIKWNKYWVLRFFGSIRLHRNRLRIYWWAHSVVTSRYLISPSCLLEIYVLVSFYQIQQLRWRDIGRLKIT